MEIIVLDHYEDIELPEVKDIEDAGVDLRAAIAETVVLQPGDDVVIPSGLKFHIGSENVPHDSFGIFGAVHPRSGLGFKHYVRLANTTGIIDAGYQGEILIKVRNEGSKELEIRRGDRICQMIFTLYLKDVKFNVVDSFSNGSNRGDNGKGSTGVV